MATPRPSPRPSPTGYSFDSVNPNATNLVTGDAGLYSGIQTRSRFDDPTVELFRWGGMPRPALAEDPFLQRRFATTTPTWYSPRAALERFQAMSPMERASVQQQLLNSGFYTDSYYGARARSPAFGQLDFDTFQALERAMSTALAFRADLNEILSGTQGMAEAAARLQQETMVGIFEVSNPAGIRAMADQVARRTLGRKATDSEKALVVSMVQASQQAPQQEAFRTRVAAQRSDVAAQLGELQAKPQAAGAPADQQAFINALVGKESGGSYTARNKRTGAYGRYQILPSNWSAWAREAGLPANAPQTPENQDRVFNHKMGQYISRYGYEGAAVAWYAGEDDAAIWARNPSDPRFDRQPAKGEPSIRQYVNSIMGKTGRPAVGGAAQPQTPESVIRSVEKTVTGAAPEAQTEELLRKRAPAEAGAHDIAGVYDMFLDIIGAKR